MSKQLFSIFHFFHRFYSNLIQLKWKNQHVISFVRVHCAYGSKLLVHTAHTVAHCQRTLRIGQQIASAHCAYSSKLLCIRQQFARVCCAYGSNLLAYTAHMVTNSQIFYALHAVANCQRMPGMRQPIASVCCTCGSNLLAQTVHAVAKAKWPISHPSVKNVKFLFHP